MSEYAEILIKKLSLYWFRNYLKKEIVELFFSKHDLFITPNYIADSEDIDSMPYERYVYKTTVKKAKERLDAMGYGLNSFEELFNQRMGDSIDYDPFLSYLHVNYDDRDKKASERIKNKVSFKKWTNSMNKIIKHELEHGNINSFRITNGFEASTECDKVIYYSLIEQDSESFYGLNPEIIQVAYTMRMILEFCVDDDEIILDFSDLANWSDDSIPKALEATGDTEKTIVLVEGTSDKNILEFALNQLFPHLEDLFYFMDFSDTHGNKRAGGASEIKRHMETFYYSKIRTRFIAIFDNDAEGYQSRYLLLNEKIKEWPSNYRVLSYPELLCFRKYPTLAPNGSILYDDINKKACSIELYLPDDIIMNKGSYIPIEWEARRTINRIDGTKEYIYQGVISDKTAIKARFNDMKKKIEKGEQAFIPKEWERMRILLEAIVFAFK